jgi:DNA replication protein DnaC
MTRIDHTIANLERAVLRTLQRTEQQRRASMADAAGDPDCPYCGGSGYLHNDVPMIDRTFGRLKYCVCHKARKAQKLQLQLTSGVEEHERQRRLSDLEVRGRPGTRLMRNACQAFCDSPAGILTIWGGPGIGKTAALQAVVNEFAAQGMQAVYVTARDLLADVRKRFKSSPAGDSGDADERLREYAGLRILALDELDKFKLTEWATQELSDLVDRRYRLDPQSGYGTLIAMNAGPDSLPDHIASRLRAGRNRVVHNADSDLRPLLES